MIHNILEKIKLFVGNFFNVPENFFRWDNWPLIIATVGGIGYVKVAPGTIASFFATAVVVSLSMIDTNILAILTIALVLIGFYVCNILHSSDSEDPPHIVIDEVVGQCIALIIVKHDIVMSIVAFVIFRILDITKPSIIRKCETFFKGGSAIMMDDIVAGFITLVITMVIYIII